MFSEKGPHSAKPGAAQEVPAGSQWPWQPLSLVPTCPSLQLITHWTWINRHLEPWQSLLLLTGEASVHCAPLHPWLPWRFFQKNSGLGNVGLRGTASSLAADVTQRQSGDAGRFYSLKKHLPLLLLAHGTQVNPPRITKTVTKKQASAISDKGNRQQQGDRRINCRDVSWKKKIHQDELQKNYALLETLKTQPVPPAHVLVKSTLT